MNLSLKNCICVSFILLLAGCSSSKKESYYVDLVKVFNEFELSKELKEKTTNESSILNSRMDSIQFELNTEQKGSEKFKLLLDQFYRLEEASTSKLDVLIAESDKKIWDLLNQYFQDFGKERNIKMLIGGKTDGTILYVDDPSDITEEFIEFANFKYQGG